MIPSPFQTSLHGLAMQAKVMTDLLKAHERFNTGLARFEELAQKVCDGTAVNKEQLARAEELIQEARAHAKDVATHMERIDALPPGVPGAPGTPGEKPTIDYGRITEEVTKRLPPTTKIDRPSPEQIAKLVLAKLPPPTTFTQPGIDHELLAGLVVDKIVTEKKLKVEHIDGLRPEIDSYRAQLAGKAYGKDTWARGGGDTVAAGSGITITTNTAGKKVITSTSAPGTPVYEEIPTGSGTAFTLAHTPLSGTLRLYRGGARQQITVDYTISGASITLMQTLISGEVLLADYEY